MKLKTLMSSAIVALVLGTSLFTSVGCSKGKDAVEKCGAVEDEKTCNESKQKNGKTCQFVDGKCKAISDKQAAITGKCGELDEPKCGKRLECKFDAAEKMCKDAKRSCSNVLDAEACNDTHGEICRWNDKASPAVCELKDDRTSGFAKFELNLIPTTGRGNTYQDRDINFIVKSRDNLNAYVVSESGTLISRLDLAGLENSDLKSVTDHASLTGNWVPFQTTGPSNAPANNIDKADFTDPRANVKFAAPSYQGAVFTLENAISGVPAKGILAIDAGVKTHGYKSNDPGSIPASGGGIAGGGDLGIAGSASNAADAHAADHIIAFKNDGVSAASELFTAAAILANSIAGGAPNIAPTSFLALPAGGALLGQANGNVLSIVPAAVAPGGGAFAAGYSDATAANFAWRFDNSTPNDVAVSALAYDGGTNIYIGLRGNGDATSNKGGVIIIKDYGLLVGGLPIAQAVNPHSSTNGKNIRSFATHANTRRVVAFAGDTIFFFSGADTEPTNIITKGDDTKLAENDTWTGDFDNVIAGTFINAEVLLIGDDNQGLATMPFRPTKPAPAATK